MKFLTLLLLVGVVLSGRVHASDVASLIEALRKTAQPGDGITSEEQKIASELQSIGAQAIPYLLPLLKDDNQDIRDLASYTLSDIDGLTEEHLNVLIESCRRGDGWIPPAIARIGTPQAVAFLVEEVVRQRRTQTQFTYAIELLGQKAVPSLVEVYRKERGWDAALEATMNSVFKELGENAAGAVSPLLNIAEDEAVSRPGRIRAIAALGAIGLAAESAVTKLQELQRHKDAKIRRSAEAAIVSIGSTDAAPILASKLDIQPNLLTLRDIAALKARGKSAGPALLKCLRGDDWDLRVGAIRALGYVGYREAANELVSMLDCPEDWRVVLSAAESLGRLNAEHAIPALSKVGTNYWYPPVREAAVLAVKAIQTGTPTESRFPADSFPFEFFDYEHAGRDMESLTEEEAKLLGFPLATETLDQSLTIPIKGKGGSVKRTTLRGVQVDDGYLIGSNRGEWGGEITFTDQKGHSRVIVGANTEAVYRTMHGIIAVTGLAHLGSNEGMVYRINKSAGKWTAKKWRALPGAPIFSRLLRDGNLLISCHGGIATVSPSGEMKSLNRSESLLRDVLKK